MKEKNVEDSYIRLLKPSYVLYILVGFCILLLSFVLTFVIKNLGVAFLISALIGVTPLIIVKPIAYLISNYAESKRENIGLWFIADIEREKQQYGPLRANRLFGHPLGRKK